INREDPPTREQARVSFDRTTSMLKNITDIICALPEGVWKQISLEAQRFYYSSSYYDEKIKWPESIDQMKELKIGAEKTTPAAKRTPQQSKKPALPLILTGTDTVAPDLDSIMKEVMGGKKIDIVTDPLSGLIGNGAKDSLAALSGASNEAARREKQKQVRVVLHCFAMSVLSVYLKKEKNLIKEEGIFAWTGDGEKREISREETVMVQRLKQLIFSCDSSMSIDEAVETLAGGYRTFLLDTKNKIPLVYRHGGGDNPSFVRLKASMILGLQPVMSPAELADKLRPEFIHSIDVFVNLAGETIMRVFMKDDGRFNAPMSPVTNIDLYAIDPANPDRMLPVERVIELAKDWERTLKILKKSEWTGKKARFAVGGIDYDFMSRKKIQQLVRTALPDMPRKEQEKIVAEAWVEEEKLELIHSSYPYATEEKQDASTVRLSWTISLFEYYSKKHPGDPSLQEIARYFIQVMMSPGSKDVFTQAQVLGAWHNRRYTEETLMEVVRKDSMSQEDLESIITLKNMVKAIVINWWKMEGEMTVHAPWSVVTAWDRTVTEEVPEELEMRREMWHRAIALVHQIMRNIREDNGGDFLILKDSGGFLNDPRDLAVLPRIGYAPFIRQEDLGEFFNNEETYVSAEVRPATETEPPALLIRLNIEEGWQFANMIIKRDKGIVPDGEKGVLKVFLFDGDRLITDEASYRKMVTDDGRLAKAGSGSLLLSDALEKGFARLLVGHVLVNEDRLCGAFLAGSTGTQKVNKEVRMEVDTIRGVFAKEKKKREPLPLKYAIPRFGQNEMIEDVRTAVVKGEIKKALEYLETWIEQTPDPMPLLELKKKVQRAGEVIEQLKMLPGRAKQITTAEDEEKLSELERRLAAIGQQNEDILEYLEARFERTQAAVAAARERVDSDKRRIQDEKDRVEREKQKEVEAERNRVRDEEDRLARERQNRIDAAREEVTGLIEGIKAIKDPENEDHIADKEQMLLLLEVKFEREKIKEELGEELDEARAELEAAKQRIKSKRIGAAKKELAGLIEGIKAIKDPENEDHIADKEQMLLLMKVRFEREKIKGKLEEELDEVRAELKRAKERIEEERRQAGQKEIERIEREKTEAIEAAKGEIRSLAGRLEEINTAEDSRRLAEISSELDALRAEDADITAVLRQEFEEANAELTAARDRIDVDLIRVRELEKEEARERIDRIQAAKAKLTALIDKIQTLDIRQRVPEDPEAFLVFIREVTESEIRADLERLSALQEEYEKLSAEYKELSEELTEEIVGVVALLGAEEKFLNRYLKVKEAVPEYDALLEELKTIKTFDDKEELAALEEKYDRLREEYVEVYDDIWILHEKIRSELHALINLMEQLEEDRGARIEEAKSRLEGLVGQIKEVKTAQDKELLAAYAEQLDALIAEYQDLENELKSKARGVRTSLAAAGKRIEKDAARIAALEKEERERAFQAAKSRIDGIIAGINEAKKREPSEVPGLLSGLYASIKELAGELGDEFAPSFEDMRRFCITENMILLDSETDEIGKMTSALMKGFKTATADQIDEVLKRFERHIENIDLLTKDINGLKEQNELDREALAALRRKKAVLSEKSADLEQRKVIKEIHPLITRSMRELQTLKITRSMPGGGTQLVYTEVGVEKISIVRTLFACLERLDTSVECARICHEKVSQIFSNTLSAKKAEAKEAAFLIDAEKRIDSGDLTASEIDELRKELDEEVPPEIEAPYTTRRSHYEGWRRALQRGLGGRRREDRDGPVEDVSSGLDISFTGTEPASEPAGTPLRRGPDRSGQQDGLRREQGQERSLGRSATRDDGRRASGIRQQKYGRERPEGRISQEKVPFANFYDRRRKQYDVIKMARAIAKEMGISAAGFKKVIHLFDGLPNRVRFIKVTDTAIRLVFARIKGDTQAKQSAIDKMAAEMTRPELGKVSREEQAAVQACLSFDPHQSSEESASGGVAIMLGLIIIFAARALLLSELPSLIPSTSLIAFCLMAGMCTVGASDSKETGRDIMEMGPDEILAGVPEDIQKHSLRVAKIATLIARELELSEEDIDLLQHTAWAHDIGQSEKSRYPETLRMLNKRLYGLSENERIEPVRDYLVRWLEDDEIMDRYGIPPEKRKIAREKVRENNYYPIWELYIVYTVLGRKDLPKEEQELSPEEQVVAGNMYSHGRDSIKKLDTMSITYPAELAVLIRYHHDYTRLEEEIDHLVREGAIPERYEQKFRKKINLLESIIIVSDVFEQGNNYARLVTDRSKPRVETFSETINGWMKKRFDKMENIKEKRPLEALEALIKREDPVLFEIVFDARRNSQFMDEDLTFIGGGRVDPTEHGFNIIAGKEAKFLAQVILATIGIGLAVSIEPLIEVYIAMRGLPSVEKLRLLIDYPFISATVWVFTLAIAIGYFSRAIRKFSKMTKAVQDAMKSWNNTFSKELKMYDIELERTPIAKATPQGIIVNRQAFNRIADSGIREDILRHDSVESAILRVLNRRKWARPLANTTLAHFIALLAIFPGIVKYMPISRKLGSFHITPMPPLPVLLHFLFKKNLRSRFLDRRFYVRMGDKLIDRQSYFRKRYIKWRHSRITRKSIFSRGEDICPFCEENAAHNEQRTRLGGWIYSVNRAPIFFKHVIAFTRKHVNQGAINTDLCLDVIRMMDSLKKHTIYWASEGGASIKGHLHIHIFEKERKPVLRTVMKWIFEWLKYIAVHRRVHTPVLDLEKRMPVEEYPVETLASNSFGKKITGLVRNYPTAGNPISAYVVFGYQEEDRIIIARRVFGIESIMRSFGLDVDKVFMRDRKSGEIRIYLYPRRKGYAAEFGGITDRVLGPVEMSGLFIIPGEEAYQDLQLKDAISVLSEVGLPLKNNESNILKKEIKKAMQEAEDLVTLHEKNLPRDVKAIVFDLDGVLSHRSLVEIRRLQVEMYKRIMDLPTSLYNSYSSGQHTKEAMDLFNRRDGASSKEIFRELIKIAPKYRRTEPLRTAEEYYEEYSRKREEAFKKMLSKGVDSLAPHVLELMALLEELPDPPELFIASCRGRESVLRFYEATGLYRYIREENIFAVPEKETRAQRSEIKLKAVQDIKRKRGLKPEQIIFLDDCISIKDVLGDEAIIGLVQNATISDQSTVTRSKEVGIDFVRTSLQPDPNFIKTITGRDKMGVEQAIDIFRISEEEIKQSLLSGEGEITYGQLMEQVIRPGVENSMKAGERFDIVIIGDPATGKTTISNTTMREDILRISQSTPVIISTDDFLKDKDERDIDHTVLVPTEDLLEKFDYERMIQSIKDHLEGKPVETTVYDETLRGRVRIGAGENMEPLLFAGAETFSLRGIEEQQKHFGETDILVLESSPSRIVLRVNDTDNVIHLSDGKIISVEANGKKQTVWRKQKLETALDVEQYAVLDKGRRFKVPGDFVDVTRRIGSDRQVYIYEGMLVLHEESLDDKFDKKLILIAHPDVTFERSRRRFYMQTGRRRDGLDERESVLLLEKRAFYESKTFTGPELERESNRDLIKVNTHTIVESIFALYREGRLTEDQYAKVLTEKLGLSAHDLKVELDKRTSSLWIGRDTETITLSGEPRTVDFTKRHIIARQLGYLEHVVLNARMRKLEKLFDEVRMRRGPPYSYWSKLFLETIPLPGSRTHRILTQAHHTFLHIPQVLESKTSDEILRDIITELYGKNVVLTQHEEMVWYEYWSFLNKYYWGNKQSELQKILQSLRQSEKQGEMGILVGVCPMSRSIIKAYVEVAQEHHFPPNLLATPRQVDIETGYTGWNQRTFYEHLLEVTAQAGYKGDIVIERDHGGPYENPAYKDLPLAEAIDEAKKTYRADIERGFSLLHIDLSLVNETNAGKKLTPDDIAEYTAELISDCERHCLRTGQKPMAYAIGSDDENSLLKEIDDIEQFIIALKRKLGNRNLAHIWNNVIYLVVDTGTKLGAGGQVGRFDPDKTKAAQEIASRYGLILKQHEADYLQEDQLKELWQSGIRALNLGPELARAEYETLEWLEEQVNEKLKSTDQKPSALMKKIEEKLTMTDLWKKWFNGARSFSDLSEEDRRTACLECGRYVQLDEEVIAARDRLYRLARELSVEADPEGVVVESIKKIILRYIKSMQDFGGEDIVSIKRDPLPDEERMGAGDPFSAERSDRNVEKKRNTPRGGPGSGILRTLILALCLCLPWFPMYNKTAQAQTTLSGDHQPTGEIDVVIENTPDITNPKELERLLHLVEVGDLKIRSGAEQDLIAAIEKMDHEQGTPIAMNLIESDSLFAKIVAFRFLTRSGDKEAEQRLSFYENLHRQIQKSRNYNNTYACQMGNRELAKIDDDLARGALIDNLKGLYWKAPGSAARALARTGDPRAFHALTNALQYPSKSYERCESLRAGIAYALGELGDKRGVEKLRMILEDRTSEKSDPGARANAVEALAKLGDMESVLGVLRTEEENPFVRCSAARAAVLLDGPELILALAGLVSDENYLVSETAKTALKKSGGISALLDELESALNSNDTDRVLALTEALELTDPAALAKCKLRYSLSKWNTPMNPIVRFSVIGISLLMLLFGLTIRFRRSLKTMYKHILSGREIPDDARIAELKSKIFALKTLRDTAVFKRRVRALRGEYGRRITRMPKIKEAIGQVKDDVANNQRIEEKKRSGEKDIEQAREMVTALKVEIKRKQAELNRLQEDAEQMKAEAERTFRELAEAETA
ncbi:MAG: class II D-tagatose-bisphosphate aldolase, non-catalytic subunit, partial [Candidatus Omnitrophica bacterium]|nr:class II D-tagatose-bisphosphate aldolase, non-catalytic subunit [Candidatus Omnitrophota bacterium]